MSFDAPEIVEIGNVSVFTSHGRAATVEEIAARALDKIICVSDTAPPVIREQAVAYREQLRKVLVFYMHEAVRADRANFARLIE